MFVVRAGGNDAVPGGKPAVEALAIDMMMPDWEGRVRFSGEHGGRMWGVSLSSVMALQKWP